MADLLFKNGNIKMLVLWEEIGLKIRFDLQIQQMILCSTFSLMNEAYKPVVFVPNSAPHKYLIGTKKSDRPTPSDFVYSMHNV